MKAKKIIVEVICFVLLMNWFYEGVYKVAYFNKYFLWSSRVPLLKMAPGFWVYFVTIIELGIAIFLIMPKYRIHTLRINIVFLFLLIFYAMYATFAFHIAFWPFHSIWGNTNWFTKMLFYVLLICLSFLSIELNKDHSTYNLKSFKRLRDMPV